MKLFIESLTHFAGQFYHTPLPLAISYEALRDSLSAGQVQSKQRVLDLCKEFQIHARNALFLGHWHGLLPRILRNYGIIESARGVEIDLCWVDFSNRMNQDWNWHSQLQDAINFQINDQTDLVVNTSCEHMSDDWLQQVPENVLIIAQSTDYDHPTHINCVRSLNEFKNKMKDIEIIKADELNCNVYKRFTILGRKKSK